MMDTDLPQLLQKLKTHGKHVTIETSGIAFMSDLECDLMSISPKLSNSLPDDPKLASAHKDFSLDIAILGELIDNYDYQLKFVVDSHSNLEEIQRTLEKIENVDLKKVMLMPQAATKDQLREKSDMVADLCEKTGFAFGPRLHIMLWGNQKGR